jgi:hypothetical protein
VDIILYADLEVSRDADTQAVTYNRVLRTKPGATYEAGDRTGRLPAVIPLDFAEFAKAFEVNGAGEDKTAAMAKKAVEPKGVKA